MSVLQEGFFIVHSPLEEREKEPCIKMPHRNGRLSDTVKKEFLLFLSPFLECPQRNKYLYKYCENGENYNRI